MTDVYLETGFTREAGKYESRLQREISTDSLESSSEKTDSFVLASGHVEKGARVWGYKGTTIIKNKC